MLINNYPEPPQKNLASAYMFVVGRKGDMDGILRYWLEKLKIAPVDQVWLESKDADKISVADLKAFSSQVLLRPLASQWRVGILPAAYRMSPEANNLLLKIFEEPPAHVFFMLTVEHEEQMLPTIRSRCQRWRLDLRDKDFEKLDIKEMQRLPYRERFHLAEAWAKEDDFIEKLDQMIAGVRNAFLNGDISGEVVNKLLEYRSMANTNVNRRLLAEVMLVSLGE